MVSRVNIGIDGIQRSGESDMQISETVASLFSTPSGEEVLRYLRAVTIEMVNGPAVSATELMHMEGQRYIVGLIERRIAHGRKHKR